MGWGFFFVGSVIFALYIWFTVWIIFDQNKKQREENNYYVEGDVMDMDGMGNFSRFPDDKSKKK